MNPITPRMQIAILRRGLSIEEIAVNLGSCYASVYKWSCGIKPKQRYARKINEFFYRAACERCLGTLRFGTKHKHLCLDCRGTGLNATFRNSSRNQNHD